MWTHCEARCGKCCIKHADPDEWTKSETVKVDKELLKRERARYPDGDKSWCEMLAFDGKTAICLVHKIYGYEAKPEGCKDYPLNFYSVVKLTKCLHQDINEGKVRIRWQS